MRILGLDVGDRYIGVAVSDPEGMLARPFTILERTEEEKDLEAIARIVSEQQAGRIVVGLPRTMNGALGRQAEKVQDFARKLQGHISVPLEYQDERLTTISARRLMLETRPKKARRKMRDDAIAAAFILQGYLDENPKEEGHD